uniref:Uncharacterized protein n=1 Tax=Anguilla anguilla TaxID=7936 RepID=A0A0E9SJM7_ANGAN
MHVPLCSRMTGQ